MSFKCMKGCSVDGRDRFIEGVFRKTESLLDFACKCMHVVERSKSKTLIF